MKKKDMEELLKMTFDPIGSCNDIEDSHPYREVYVLACHIPGAIFCGVLFLFALILCKIGFIPGSLFFFLLGVVGVAYYAIRMIVEIFFTLFADPDEKK